MTRGGPVANAYWTIDDNVIRSNATFMTERVVLNYTAAVYNHTLFVLADAPGVYMFIAENPFATSGGTFLSASHRVEGKKCLLCTDT